MYVYEYLIYNLQPFGIINLPQSLPSMVSFEYVAKMNKATTISTQIIHTTLVDVNTTTSVEDVVGGDFNSTIEDIISSPAPPLDLVTTETLNVSSAVTDKN
jgi:hypothetical protein